MRYMLGAAALVGLASPIVAQDRFAERCTGTETVEIGAGAPRHVRYALTFSADLSSGYYCYAQCLPEQTYPIADRAGDPIRLADVRSGSQVRLMTFDRKTSVLTDHQVFTMLGTVRRDTRATCRSAIFHAPVPLAKG